ncbi:MAG: rhodanese-like domain-containing protein [Pseudomonadota bacterium]
MAVYNDRVLSADQAHQRAKSNDILLIDIRRSDEWEQTGIAEHAHAITMDDHDFIGKLEALTEGNKDANVAIMCAAGGRSARVVQALQDAGYNFVYNVPEGMIGGQSGKGWLARGLPTVKYQPE